MKIRKLLLGAICLLCFSSCLLSTQNAFGASGGDGGVSGGSCAPSQYYYSIWWDTCHGGVWRRYETNGRDYIEIPSPSSHVSGGVISGCGQYKYFYRLALVAYYPYKGGYSGNQVGLLPVNEFVPGGGSAAYGTSNGDSQPSWNRAYTLFKQAQDAGAAWTTWENTSWFCYDPSFGDDPDPVVENVTLTIVAIDTAGDTIGKTWSVTGKPNTTLSKTISNISGYIFLGFKKTKKASYYASTGTLTYSEAIDTNTTRYAVYERSQFKGYAGVSSGSSSTNTGWQSGSSYKKIDVDCPNSGCSAKFELGVTRTAGSGNTSYVIEKSTNGGSSYPYVITSGSTSNLWKTYTEIVAPGKTTCYRIRFSPEYGASDYSSSEAVCFYAKPSYFQGYTSVAGAVSNSVGYTSTSSTKTVTINNCSATSGCSITFYHYLKRTSDSGFGSTTYKITRTSNLTSKVSDFNGTTTTFDPGSNGNPYASNVYNSGTLTLYPGMVVCEKINFKSNNINDETADVEICVHALGNAQPDDPDDPTPTTDTDPNSSNDSAFLRMKVKNSSVSRYSYYQSAVYAKPGDTLSFRATYNPTLQYTYSLIPQRLQINGGTIFPANGTLNTSNTVGYIFNNSLKSAAGINEDWNNAFSVQRSKDSFSTNTLIADYTTFAAGDTSRRVESNEYSPVATDDVGKTISERAITNLNSSTKTTPSQVTFTENSGNLGNVITTQISSSAVAYVPYNFINSTNIDIAANADTVLYAGEEQSISFEIITSPKTNSLTTNSSSEAYATKVSGAKYKLLVCRSDGQALPNSNSNCLYTNEYTSDLNTNSDKSGSTKTLTDGADAIKIIVPDVPAGTELCVTSMVYPTTSGADSNWSDKEGNHTWGGESTKCFTVAKRPSLQVLGGNLYSGGAIKTSAAVKKHVSGVNDSEYQLDANSYSGNSYVFGSWGELGVIASGKITNFASGAATGYSSGSIETKTDFCNRVPLTFANARTDSGDCRASSIGLLSNASTNSDVTSSVSELFSKFISSETPTVDEVGEVGVETVVPKNTTKVYYSTGDLTVVGNITYENTTYTSINEIPKTLIYATGEVKINCDVLRIDAVIVAEKVTTCANGTDNINDEIYSNQLVVNGAIITSSLVANRTYGAATGAGTAYDSVTAAEIINFDVSLYRWEIESGNSESGSSGSSTSGDSADSTNLTTTYLKELAPRH